MEFKYPQFYDKILYNIQHEIDKIEIFTKFIIK